MTGLFVCFCNRSRKSERTNQMMAEIRKSRCHASWLGLRRFLTNTIIWLAAFMFVVFHCNASWSLEKKKRLEVRKNSHPRQTYSSFREIFHFLSRMFSRCLSFALFSFCFNVCIFSMFVVATFTIAICQLMIDADLLIVYSSSWDITCNRSSF